MQTFLANQVLNSVAQKTKYEISLARVNISWLDQASLNELLIFDKQKDTLIYAENLSINYRILDLINGDYLNVEEISSRELKLQMIRHNDSSKLNLSDFINSLKSDSIKKKKKAIHVGYIELKDFDFRLLDKTKEKKPNQVDFTNLNLSIPNFEMTDLEIRSDTISGTLLQMQGLETNSGFQINDFNSVFQLSSTSLSVDDLDLITPTSHITDSLEFFYSGLSDFSTFIDSVSFVFHFENTIISTEDFSMISGLNSLKSDISLDGFIWGTVGDFNIEDAKISFGKESFLEGGVSCFGLPDIKKAFILADLTKAHVIPSDIEDYTGNISPNIKRLGRIDFTGSFAGFIHDFVAKGDFNTDLGFLRSDINLKIPNEATEMKYKGNLELDHFNIGAFIENDIVQTVNLRAKIDGQGIRKENAIFDLKATVFNSGLKEYFYDSITADGRFASNFFDGSFSIQDPNCNLRGNAQIDFKHEIKVLNVDMIVDSVFLDKLNLSSKPLFLSGYLDMEAQDLNIDRFRGFANIDSANIIINHVNQIHVDSLRLSAQFEDSIRVFDLVMPGLESELRGDFKISDAINDLPILVNAYLQKLNLTNDTISSIVSESNYKMELKAEFEGFSRYLDSLDLSFEMPNNVVLESNFRKSKNFNVSTFFQTDYIFINNVEIYNPTIEINGSNSDGSESFLTNFIFSSDKQVFKGVPETTNLLIEGVWMNNDIDISALIKQEATNSELMVESKIDLMKDSLIVKMESSKVILFNEEWDFNPNNRITLIPEKIVIKDLEIFDETELLSLNGIYSSTALASLNITSKHLNMNKISLFSKNEVDGFLNGTFRIFKNDSSESFKLDGGFEVIQLKLDNLLIGNVLGSADWNPITKSVNAKVEVTRGDFKSIQVKGKYFPLRSEEQLDFDIDFDQADLIMGEPFLADNFSNIEGKANGTLKIGGTIASPKVGGSCAVENGKATINYLNTDYSFDGKIVFDEDRITFSNFDLADRKGSRAKVAGYLSHDYFQDISASIQIRANNFEFLNTTYLENKLYYGSAYGTGTIDIIGPFTDLLIKASVRTDGDTRLFIPLAESTNVDQEEYISFINLADTANIVEEEVQFKGLTLDFDIEVTPDAYCELIFDLKAGDIIRGRGSGNLKLTLDTDGEFHMFGPLEIADGAYNFTMANIISKEFTVTPGGRITWYGSPYNAILDLEATYLQRASFSTLNSTESSDETVTSQSIPLLVVLDLSGDMLSPDFDFDIQLQNQGDGDGTEESQLTSIRTDEQELRRQVVSLMFLKRFSPKSTFFNPSQQGFDVQGSAGEVLSGQLSYLLSQVDDNLEIDVDLANLDREAFNTLQLRLAYTFLDGRLKVTRGGGVGVQDGSSDSDALSDIVGDISVEYSLTKDGKLRAKVFRNTNQSLILENERIQETGVSLRFVHSFSDFKELLSLQRSEAISSNLQQTIEEDSISIEKDTLQLEY